MITDIQTNPSSVQYNTNDMIHKIIYKVYDNGLLTFNKSFRND